MISALSILALGLLLTLFLLVFYTIIIPNIKLNKIKRMYGEKIKIIYHFGAGLLAEYRKGLKNKNDSLIFLREMALTEKSKVKAYCFNLGLKFGYCFLDPELIKQVH
ncbi:hypothetical protein ABPG74_007734 [Tetrahymena malaccensis]